MVVTNIKKRGKLGEIENLQLGILRYANQGGSRSDFLRDISFKILESIQFDSIEFRLQEDDFNYFSEATIKPEPNFRLGVVNPITLQNGKEIPCTDSDHILEKLFINSITRYIAKKTGLGNEIIGHENIINHNIVIRDYEDGVINVNGNPSDLAGYVSFIIIPFSVDDRNVGILIFKSSEKKEFDNNLIELYRLFARAIGTAVAVRRTQYKLGERVKELSCLHAIASIESQPTVPVADIMNRIVLLLPPAMQYPDIAEGRIILDGVSYRSEGYKETSDKLTANITVNNEVRGAVEIIYGEAKSGFEPGLFLLEEQSLINAIAKQISLILESRQAEKEKADLQSQLRQADRLATIGQLAAGVAHELNEPLNSILGFAELIKMHPGLPSEIVGDTDKIINASFHASDIVKKLLLFAREIAAGKSNVDINKTIEDGMYFIESRCAKENIDLRYNLSEGIPETNVDAGQINQVIVNLAVNAIQAMPTGGTLTISTDADEKYVYIIVEDTGIGMTQEIIDQIFLPFFTTKDIGEGTGLGLAVVHGIVTSHGGYIAAESEEGSGTRFTIRIPILRLRNGEVV